MSGTKVKNIFVPDIKAEIHQKFEDQFSEIPSYFPKLNTFVLASFLLNKL